jgi:hypothetical protein
MRSLLHNAEGKTKSYIPMENYGLTEAGYQYVGKLLKFSQPASKEIRYTYMMTENRKNTIEARSRYEKELTSKRMSASAIVAHARRSDEAKTLPSQRKSASATVAHARRSDEAKKLPSQRKSASAAGGRSDEAKKLPSQRKSASMIVAHAEK